MPTSIRNVLKNPDDWLQVYADDSVVIKINKKYREIEKPIIKYLVYWEWVQVRELKMTPGVSYKSRLEILGIDNVNKNLRTLSAKLFDGSGTELEFAKTVPSGEWDSVTPGSIMEIVLGKLSNCEERS